MTKRPNKRLQDGFIACAAQWKLFLLRKLQTRIIQTQEEEEEVKGSALVFFHFPYMKRFTAHHMKRLEKSVIHSNFQTCVRDSPGRHVCRLCTCRSNMCDGFIPQSRTSRKKKKLCHYSTSAAHKTLLSYSDLATITPPPPPQGSACRWWVLFLLFEGLALGLCSAPSEAI